jgi:hypothetical protein
MEQKFPKGIRAFKPRENAPQFVVSELVIDPKELVQYCNDNKNLLTDYKGADQLKLTVLLSKDGTKHNIQVNTFKPTAKVETPDLPF